MSKSSQNIKNDAKGDMYNGNLREETGSANDFELDNVKTEKEEEESVNIAPFPESSGTKKAMYKSSTVPVYYFSKYWFFCLQIAFNF